MHTFTRPEMDYRVAYEALRSNKLSESKSVYALLLAQMIGTGDAIVTDLRKLPEFEKLAPYLGPAGMYLVSGKDGWVLNGFSLRPKR